MIEEKLEVLIFTYNRAVSLDQTLEQFRASPFAGCRITVLDNCSTDETPAVCERHRAAFRHLRVVRHRVNIGLCANFLRAVELSTSAYTWIVGDDDRYNFSDAEDVIQAVVSEKYDLVSLGSAGPVPWQAGVSTTADALVPEGFFKICSFVPSMIFRTVRFDSQCVASGYRNALYMFPHFAFVEKSVAERFRVYVTRERMVSRDDGFNVFGYLGYVAGWACNTRTVQDAWVRKHVAYDVLGPPATFGRRLAQWIALDKIHYPARVRGDFRQLVNSLSLNYWVASLPAWPVAWMPAWVFQWARKANRWRIGKTATGEPASAPDVFRT